MVGNRTVLRDTIRDCTTGRSTPWRRIPAASGPARILRPVAAGGCMKQVQPSVAEGVCMKQVQPSGRQVAAVTQPADPAANVASADNRPADPASPEFSQAEREFF
jgi:hypothetical protein